MGIFIYVQKGVLLAFEGYVVPARYMKINLYLQLIFRLGREGHYVLRYIHDTMTY